MIYRQLSRSYNINTGVPQGSVLGPVLFSILVNDLPCLETLTAVQYADDVNIVLHSKDTDTSHLLKKISSQMTKVKSWCASNNQALNTDKSKLLVKTRNANDQPIHESVKVVNSTKILGVYLNDQMTWNSHIDSLCKTACQRLHILRTLKPYTNPAELHDCLLYTSPSPRDLSTSRMPSSA